MCQNHTRCAVTVLAAPGSVPRARTHFREWLELLDWPHGHRDDLVLVVNEAVTNAVEHSGDGPDQLGGVDQVVGITADVEQPAGSDQQQLRIRVRDQGRWREPPVDPGHRGLGLRLMYELMQQVRITHGQIGTEVLLVSPAVDATTRPGQA